MPGVNGSQIRKAPAGHLHGHRRRRTVVQGPDPGASLLAPRNGKALCARATGIVKLLGDDEPERPPPKGMERMGNPNLRRS
jgi:hypothetical protein